MLRSCNIFQSIYQYQILFLNIMVTTTKENSKNLFNVFSNDVSSTWVAEINETNRWESYDAQQRQSLGYQALKSHDATVASQTINDWESHNICH